MFQRVKRHAVVQPEDQSIRLIPLTQGKNAIVDAADYEWLTQWHWSASRNGDHFYAQRSEKEKNGLDNWYSIPMSRAILSAPKHYQVDHINHNTLDNRRCNLRLATPAENAKNRERQKRCKSQWKGVVKDR